VLFDVGHVHQQPAKGHRARSDALAELIVGEPARLPLEGRAMKLKKTNQRFEFADRKVGFGATLFVNGHRVKVRAPASSRSRPPQP